MGVTEVNNPKYRYPGTKFFEPEQRDIFFGRSQECRDLIHAIKAHDVFVIYADSGIGKTSLLNAGLIPELINENIEPIRLRFQDTEASPIQEVVSTLAAYEKDRNISTSTNAQKKLWHLFKRCDFKSKRPLFIFDQFEEFFNHPKQHRDEFISELADLVSDYLPDYVRAEMRQRFIDKDPTSEDLLYYTPTRLKTLFLIRADKLKLLDDLSKKIPLILRNRFHLRPLNVEQAEQAICIPASLDRNGFASPPFGFKPGAIEGISNYLKNEEGEVESFQLQILCQELEKRIINRHLSEKSGTSLFITEEELGGEQGLDGITKNYYSNQINSIPDEKMKQKAVELIEDKLIVDDRRISLPEVLLINQGYSKDLLDYLLNTTRLIRVDNDRYVEISHDRLLPSILKSKRERVEEDERLMKIKELQRLKAEEEKKNQELQKQKQEEIKNLELQLLKEKVRKAAKLRLLSIILIVLLIGCLVAVYYANEARINSKIAIVNSLITDQEYGTAEAELNYHNLSNILNFSSLATFKNLNDTIQYKKAQQSQYEHFIKVGDSLIASGDLKGLEWYKKAEKTGFVPLEATKNVSNKIHETEDTFLQIFVEKVNATNSFLNAVGGADSEETKKAFKEAKEFYSLAKKYQIPIDSASEEQFNLLSQILSE